MQSVVNHLRGFVYIDYLLYICYHDNRYVYSLFSIRAGL
ncbi:MAG: hypothetical protein K0R82_390 [Flavipsychrobacter sp.]|jgi:hypothetical protein|nr:hypothetical protein [Flavipsychrobacter sp.]